MIIRLSLIYKDGQCCKNYLLMVLNGRIIKPNLGEEYIKNYHENSDKGHIFDFGTEYLTNLHDSHSGLPFLPEKIKPKKSLCNL